MQVYIDSVEGGTDTQDSIYMRKQPKNNTNSRSICVGHRRISRERGTIEADPRNVCVSP